MAEYPSLPKLTAFLKTHGNDRDSMRGVLTDLGFVAKLAWEGVQTDEDRSARAEAYLVLRRPSWLQATDTSHEIDLNDLSRFKFNFADLWNFVTSNLYLIGNPESLIHGDGSITRGEEWFLRCALQPEADLDGAMEQLLGPLLVTQPVHQSQGDASLLAEAQATQVSSSFVNQIRDLVPPMTAYPSLHNALQPFIQPDSFDGEAVCFVVREFQWFAMWAADLWIDWFDYIEYGDYLTNHTCADIADQIEEAFRDRMTDPFATAPIRVRRVVTHLNPHAESIFLAKYVFPTLVSERGRLYSNMFGWEISQWVLNAAQVVDNQPSRPVAQLITSRFYPPYHEGRTNYRPPGMVRELRHEETDDEQLEPTEDVELEAYGSRLDIGDYAFMVSTYPSDDQCVICQYDFERDDGPIVFLQRCSHPFHKTCMDEWINMAHKSHVVSCPICRRGICRARSVRPVIPDDEDDEIEDYEDEYD